MTSFFVDDQVTIAELGPEYRLLDEAAVMEFNHELLDRITIMDPPWLVVDLTHTRFIASNFLEALVRAWKRLRVRQGHLFLVGLQPACHDVLHVSKLDTLWPTFSTRAQAIAALTSLQPPSVAS